MMGKRLAFSDERDKRPKREEKTDWKRLSEYKDFIYEVRGGYHQEHYATKNDLAVVLDDLREQRESLESLKREVRTMKEHIVVVFCGKLFPLKEPYIIFLEPFLARNIGMTSVAKSCEGNEEIIDEGKTINEAINVIEDNFNGWLNNREEFKNSKTWLQGRIFKDKSLIEISQMSFRCFTQLLTFALAIQHRSDIAVFRIFVVEFAKRLRRKD